MILRKLIKKFNAKYGKEFGMIDSDFSNSGLYQAYKLISQLCKYDDEIMDMLDKIVLPLPTNPIETLEYAQIKAPQVVTKYNELEEKPVVKLEGTEDNPIILSELEVGMYVVDTDIEKSKMKYFEDDATTMNLTRQMVLINEFYNIKYVNTYSLFDGIATTYELDLANKKVRNYRGVTGEDVLAKDNTFEYEPTEDFHPATKKYVDDTTSSNSIEISDEEFDSLYDSKGTKILLGEMTKVSKGTPILTSYGDGVYNVNGSSTNKLVENEEDLLLEEQLGRVIQVNKLNEECKYGFNVETLKDMCQLDYLEINDNREEANEIFYDSKLTNIDKVIVKSGNADCLFENSMRLKTVNEVDLIGSTSAKRLFAGCENLKSINSIKNTENVFYFDYMFAGCLSLKQFPTISTSNALSLCGLFRGTNIENPPELDTSNVVDMSRMFLDCRNITTIPDYDTTNVVNFESMFDSSTITKLPVTFTTSNGENFSRMFFNAYNLILDVPIDTSKAVDMSGMFYNTLITKIPEGFTIPSTCRDISQLFCNCTALQDTLPIVDLSNVENMKNAFSSTLSFSQEVFDTSKCENFYSAFYGNLNIEKITIDISNIKSGQYRLSGLAYIFANCTNLKEVHLAGKSEEAFDFTHAFGYCRNLVRVTSDYPIKVTGSEVAFDECNVIEEIPEIDFSECTAMAQMFYRCHKLAVIPTVFDLKNYKGSLLNFFRENHSIVEVNLRNANNVISYDRCFNHCQSLERITGVDVSSNEAWAYMFNNCPKLTYIELTSDNSEKLIHTLKNESVTYIPWHSGSAFGEYVYDISKCRNDVIDEVMEAMGSNVSPRGWSIITGREELE